MPATPITTTCSPNLFAGSPPAWKNLAGPAPVRFGMSIPAPSSSVTSPNGPASASSAKGVIAATGPKISSRKIRIDGEKTGKTITRFSAIERFGHWLLAGSFVVLGITGLALLFGRVAIIPLIGHEAYAPVIIAGKWAHNNLSWAFMLGLALVTVFWIAHNIPNKHDLKWLAVGGGLFSKGVHPPARKFNAGQKLIFWSVVVLGISISVSGISLLFPFEFHLFGPTFAKLNALGLPQALGFGELATDLGPHAEMQLSQLWHAIISFVFMAIIIGHIYIGSVGMEGAFDAMGSGEVEVQWAKEHHGLWYEEVTGEKAHGPHDATPAE